MTYSCDGGYIVKKEMVYMIQYTFKVYPKGRGREIYRVFTMSGQDTLDDLCDYILQEFDFSHEQ